MWAEGHFVIFTCEPDAQTALGRARVALDRDLLSDAILAKETHR